MTLALITAVLLVVVGWTAFRPVSPLVLADRAGAGGAIDPLLAALRRGPAASQPTEYHRVIKRLWEGYHRDVAVRLAIAFARAHRDAPVAQYWLRRFLEDEPEIAAEHLDPTFLAEFYDPAVAARCGSYG